MNKRIFFFRQTTLSSVGGNGRVAGRFSHDFRHRRGEQFFADLPRHHDGGHVNRCFKGGRQNIRRVVTGDREAIFVIRPLSFDYLRGFIGQGKDNLGDQRVPTRTVIRPRNFEDIFASGRKLVDG